MSQRISILVALEGADEGLKRALTSAERSLGELASTAKSAGAKTAAGMVEVLSRRRPDLPPDGLELGHAERSALVSRL